MSDEGLELFLAALENMLDDERTDALDNLYYEDLEAEQDD